MKLPELRKKFKNKYAIRIAAGVLVVALVGTGVSTMEVDAARREKSVTESTQTGDTDKVSGGIHTEKSLSDALSSSFTVNEKEIGKEETVYVIADSNGMAKEIIVSDHLMNQENKETLEDASTLKDITNVKGEETFTQNGQKLTWQAGGNDIYYRGTSAKETPVAQKITYFLDGKEIVPEKLAGNSGRVTIRFDYTNNEKVKTGIDGKETDICVPFVAISGLVLDESFTNIKVTNGKVTADGNRNLVIGYTLPGLADSLNVNASDFDKDISISDYFEVSADVEDFALDMTMTVVMNATNFVSANGGNDFSNLDDLLDSLTDATSQLEHGSSALADGVDTLQSKLGEFSNGVNTLQNGIQSYTDGASSLQAGVGSLKSGVDTLAGSVPALVDGIGQLKTGADSAADGAFSLSDGASRVSAGVDTLSAMMQGMGSILEAGKQQSYAQFEASAGMGYDAAAGVIDTLHTAQENLKTGIGYDVQAADYIAQALAADDTYLQLKGAANTYYTGVQQALAESGMSFSVGNAFEAAEVIDALGDTIASLQAGRGQVEGAAAAIDTMGASLLSSENSQQLAALQDGAKQVADGAASLAEGVHALDEGLTALNDKTGILSNGVSQLQSGAGHLADGASALTSNSAALVNGAGTLSEGTTAIIQGVGTLGDGAHELADGMVQFNEEGIEKILNSYQGDIKPLVERIQAVLDAGEDYQTYTDIADGVTGSVKFIYKTASVKESN